jgi:hypothetical protein
MCRWRSGREYGAARRIYSIAFEKGAVSEPNRCRL